ncbi:aspartate dehydrogenase domain-containing protein [Granulicoccus phenolivorans]|uniref:aspartate dehydrogenase domain-containing protein n=1 Tax=Granulicoccus phenolivorans TaxID=266854 RepID=UPI00047B58BB|nr:aspartate dehydrogenase domain-containing protein [Granulicoccus phenolivorans]
MSRALRVVVLGHGEIGSVVARELAAGRVPGAELVGVVNRSPVADPPVAQIELAAAVERADLIVECAGQPAVHEIVDPVTSAGVDLLVTSVGALLDPRLAGRLATLGPGRLLGTHGAVGGLDLLSSASRAGGFERVVLRTTKKPKALVRDWMEPAQATRILDATAPVAVFAGTAGEAVQLFPDSLNVAAGVALAIGGTECLTIELSADPAATVTTHRIEAVGELGRYAFEVQNHPSAANPRSSAITPYSALHSIAMLTRQPPSVI